MRYVWTYQLLALNSCWRLKHHSLSYHPRIHFSPLNSYPSSPCRPSPQTKVQKFPPLSLETLNRMFFKSHSTHKRFNVEVRDSLTLTFSSCQVVWDSLARECSGHMCFVIFDWKKSVVKLIKGSSLLDKESLLKHQGFLHVCPILPSKGPRSFGWFHDGLSDEER